MYTVSNYWQRSLPSPSLKFWLDSLTWRWRKDWKTQSSRECSNALLFSFTYPWTAGVVGAPHMTSQPVSFTLLCYPLPFGSLTNPKSLHPLMLSLCLSFWLHCLLPVLLRLAKWFRPNLMNRGHAQRSVAFQQTSKLDCPRSTQLGGNWVTYHVIVRFCWFLCLKHFFFFFFGGVFLRHRLYSKRRFFLSHGT